MFSYDTTLQLLVMSSCIYAVREPAGACFLFSCFTANSLQLCCSVEDILSSGGRQRFFVVHLLSYVELSSRYNYYAQSRHIIVPFFGC
jgi:hypothetical protein